METEINETSKQSEQDENDLPKKIGSELFLPTTKWTNFAVGYFPNIVYFILASMLCEHLCETGLKSVMALYFQRMLDLKGHQITVAIHSLNCFKYCAVLIGAILADSYFGKIKTILFGQIVYSLGTVLLTISSLVKRAFPSRFILILAMVSKIIGLGGILPCLMPLAADQISEENSQKKVKELFILYFIAVQACDVLSLLLVPMMKEVPCFKLETCYPLAFGAPALFSLFSLGLFMYVQHNCFSIPPRQPMVIQGVQCCYYALKMKIRRRKEVNKKHWLDYAEDRFNENFIEAVKKTLNVMSIPTPIYWALYDQQSTTWTMQASRMDTEVGLLRVLPDQVQALCPILFFVFVPLFHYFLYNIDSLRIMNTLLKRMILGGFLISIPFFIAYFVELKIENSYKQHFNSHESNLTFFNGLDTTVSIAIESQNVTIRPHSSRNLIFNIQHNLENFEFNVSYDRTIIKGILTAKEKKSQSYIIVNPHPVKLMKIDDIDKPTNHPTSLIAVRLICTDQIYCKNLKVTLIPDTWFLTVERNSTISDVSSGVYFRNLSPGSYQVKIEFKIENNIMTKLLQSTLNLKNGGVYTLMVYFEEQVPDATLFEIIQPNSVSVLWILPQYIILSISGVLFIISAYSFIYTETPEMFRSFSWSMCYMTLSTGNMVTVIVGGPSFEPSFTFLLFAVTILIGMCFFTYSAILYKY